MQTNNPIEAYFIDNCPHIMREIQAQLKGPFIDQVTRTLWPKETGIKPFKFQTIIPPGGEERTYSLKKMSIQSPNICLDDIKFFWQVQDQIKHVQHLFTQNLQYVWKRSFRRDIINTITTRRINRIPPAVFLEDSLPRRLNFFGKEVPAYANYDGFRKWAINPKYKRAAIQYVEFHPDIVHFLFPTENWMGELTWRKVQDTQYDPEGRLGFFRVMLTYAAKPVRPDLSSVTTVPPPGFLGTLWYWAWKLVGFIP